MCSPGSRLCPPGWVGTVTIGGATLVTAPTEPAAALMSAAWARRPPPTTEPDSRPTVVELTRWTAEVGLTVLERLGPAELAYLARLAVDPRPVERVAAGHPDLAALFGAVAADERNESGLDRPAAEPGSDVAVVRDGGRIVAAAAYTPWPGGAAHVGILTATGARGRGLATAVGAAISADALAAGLLPQWRAQVPASQLVAAKLGYRVLGRQFSLRLRD